jgi:hypothetical protein
MILETLSIIRTPLLLQSKCNALLTDGVQGLETFAFDFEKFG